MTRVSLTAKTEKGLISGPILIRMITEKLVLELVLLTFLEFVRLCLRRLGSFSNKFELFQPGSIFIDLVLSSPKTAGVFERL